MTFRKFSSIEQFSNVVKDVRQYAKKTQTPLPVVNFKGTTKLHGTNGCIAFIGDKIQFQSRERILSYESDNAGFCFWGLQNEQNLLELRKHMGNEYNLDPKTNVYIYGEWCCGSIQKGVALNQIPEKKFAIFDIVSVTEDKEWEEDPAFINWDEFISNMFVAENIISWEMQIDFNEPHLAQNKLLELTLEVEECCPVGRYFGVTGTGEGIVWTGFIDGRKLRFKTKGEKHSASKVKTVRELTAAEIASKENAKEFVDYACSENRLRQGIDKLNEMGLPVDIKSMGPYLKWIGNDILTECKDVIIESKIERKDVMPAIADKARNWFLTYLQENV